MFKKEPVLVTHAVAAVLAWLATFLVTHGVITSTHASALVQEILPTVAAAVLMAQAVIVRRFVSPAVDKAESMLPLDAVWVHDARPAIVSAETALNEGLGQLVEAGTPAPTG
jgi:hypothetical protein